MTLPGYVRVGFRLTALVVALAGALLLHGAWRAVRAPSPWPPRFLGLVARIVGAQARTVGVPLQRDGLVVSNHLSWIDILVLAQASGAAFVAKDDLAKVPLIGWLCTLNHTIFIARGDRAGVGAQVATIRRALLTGRPVGVFPEGTTGDGRTLRPFKAALFEAFDPPPPGVRVQPVRIDYGAATDDIVWGAETGGANALRLLARAGTFAVTLRFAEPFDPAEFAGRKAIAAEARRRMEAAVPSSRPTPSAAG